MSKYIYNKDYFEKIDNADKAYWLGFLYADGCINSVYKNDKLKNMSLELTLCEQDKEHLVKFRDSLESNVPISEKLVKNKDKIYKSYRIVINCTKLCKDLCSLGCTPRKTYDLSFPSYDIVPSKYMRDFIRGFFEGDGCIHTSTMSGEPHIEISITGMESMLREICDFLISERILRVYPKIHKDKRSKASSVYMYGTDAVKDILDYLYKNSNIYLSRKYEKYINFYKDYDENSPRYGVYWSKRNKAYVVNITIDGKNIRIGQYKDIKEANDARIQAEIEKMNIENAS